MHLLNATFKFSIYQKLSEKIAFLGLPPKPGLFSIPLFLMVNRKSARINKISKDDLHVFFITFFL